MHILLVDGKSKSLVKFTDLFSKHQCKTAYFEDPVLAIKALAIHSFDAIICCDNMIKTSALNLLKVTALKFPTVIGIAFVANSAENDISNTAHYIFEHTPSHQDVIDTVVALEGSKKNITKEVIVKAVASVKTLPSPPKVYLQLNAVLKNSNSDSDKIAEIITQDPALVAKVLQFSNTSFMPNGKKLTNITEAITKMGVDTLSCIVMTAELFSYQPDIPNFSLQEEQLHSLATARFAASMVDNVFKHDALLAGLLHDLGKFVLFEIDKALTLKYFDNKARTSSDILLERKIFGTDHCQIGAYLLHVWSFPYDIIDAVLHHHNPKKLLTKNFGVAQAVYVANAILRERELDPAFVAHYQLANSIEKLQQKAQHYK